MVGGVVTGTVAAERALIEEQLAVALAEGDRERVWHLRTELAALVLADEEGEG